MDLTALAAEVEEEGVQANNLNATRMARQSLPSTQRGRTGDKRPAGGPSARRASSEPAPRPPLCAKCGGHHRLKVCPKTLSDKDQEYLRRKADGTLPYTTCDYKDPKGGWLCGGEHLRSHHKQAIIEYGVSRAGPRSGAGRQRGAQKGNGKGRKTGREAGRGARPKGAGRADCHPKVSPAQRKALHRAARCPRERWAVARRPGPQPGG